MTIHITNPKTTLDLDIETFDKYYLELENRKVRIECVLESSVCQPITSSRPSILKLVDGTSQKSFHFRQMVLQRYKTLLKKGSLLCLNLLIKKDKMSNKLVYELISIDSLEGGIL